MVKKYLYLAFIAVIAVVSSCGEGTEKKVDVPKEIIEDGTAEVELDSAPIDRIIESFSSPIEMAASIESMDIPYSQKILVPTASADMFETNFKKSMGLGMLSANLGYLNVYKKVNTIVEYLTVIKRIADDLDIDQYFDFQTLKRLATNSDNLDSLMMLSVSSHHRMDEHLRSTGRSDLSALMVTGVWIEGMYLAVSVDELKRSDEMRNQVGDQKNILSDLYYVLKFFESKPHFKELITDFDALKEAYEGVTITTVPGETRTVVENGVTVTYSGDETVIQMTDEQYAEIAENIKKIRNKLISL